MLEGRTVLVTGASSGIGRATALLLARLGAHVLAGMRTPRELCEGVTPVKLDITAPEDLAALDLTRLDGLVNNAGIAITGPLEFLPLDELRRQLEVNVIAQIAVTQACMPALRNRGGRIVNLSSISGSCRAAALRAVRGVEVRAGGAQRLAPPRAARCR
jgi:NAD(P)-dependent dehydrogenase (short-subunit alcohol dehydrogenase family)